MRLYPLLCWIRLRLEIETMMLRKSWDDSLKKGSPSKPKPGKRGVSAPAAFPELFRSGTLSAFTIASTEQQRTSSRSITGLAFVFRVPRSFRGALQQVNSSVYDDELVSSNDLARVVVPCPFQSVLKGGLRLHTRVWYVGVQWECREFRHATTLCCLYIGAQEKLQSSS